MIQLPKERPRCRKVIIGNGWIPYIDEFGILKARCLDGKTTNLSDGLKIQMRLMMMQGYWRA